MVIGSLVVKSNSLRLIFSILSISFVLLISGAFFELAKEGGAQPEGIRLVEDYSGPLNFIGTVWKGLAALAIIYSVFLKGSAVFKVSFEVLILLVLCFLSMLWASTPYEAFSQSVALSILVLFCRCHFIVSGAFGCIRDLNRAIFIVAASSFFYVVFLPDYGISVGEHDGKWQGVFNHKNALGNFSAYSLILVVWARYNFQYPAYWALAFMLLALLLFSQSYTSYFVAASGLGVYLISSTQPFSNRRGLIFHYVFILISIGALVTAAFGIEIEVAGKTAGFSGRNELWLNIFLNWYQGPFLGRGFSQLYSDVSANSSLFSIGDGFVVGSAHNGFLELLYGLGLVGLAAFLIFMHKQIRKSNSVFLSLLVSVSCALVALNAMESRLLGWNYYFLVYVYVSLAARSKLKPSSFNRDPLRPRRFKG